MTQKELEMKIIAHICTFEDDMLHLLNEGIDGNDFIYIENGKIPLFRKLFLSAKNYYQKFERLLSQETIESKLKQKDEDISSNKMLSLFTLAMSTDIDHSSFPMLVKDLRSKRLNQVLQEIMCTVNDSLKNESPAFTFEKLKDKILDAEADLDKNASKSNRVYILNEGYNDIVNKYQDKKNNPEKYKGIEVGMSVLDFATNGFKPSTFNLVVAASGAGKSITLLNWAAEVFQRNYNVLFFSLEMPQDQVIGRYISRELCIDYQRYDNGKLTEEEEEILLTKLPKILNSKDDNKIITKTDNKATFVIYTNFDNPDVTYIEDMLRRHQKIHGKVDAIFVDYLNNMKSEEVLKTRGQEWAHAGACAQGLRRIAANYGLTIFSAQQINRSGLEKGRKSMETDPANFNANQEDITASQSAFHSSDSVIACNPDINNFKMYYKKVKARDFTFEPFAVNYYPSMNRLVDAKVDDTAFMLSPLSARINIDYQLPSEDDDGTLIDDFGEV